MTQGEQTLLESLGEARIAAGDVVAGDHRVVRVIVIVGPLGIWSWLAHWLSVRTPSAS